MSPDTPYRALGLESLTDRRWIRKLVFFYKIANGLSPQYLCRYLNFNNTFTYTTRSFFRFCINEWRKLDNLTKK